jgi:glucose-6-phosphate 1-dehydrogenase
MSGPPSAAGRTVRTPGDVSPAERARVIVEKPFGTDLESGRTLNATVHEVFGEEQIPAIDHSDCGGALAQDRHRQPKRS